MTRSAAGDIVLADWRGGAMPGEPTRIRPAVVVENPDLFANDYQMVIVVPMTRDQRLAHPAFAIRIEPTAENGAPATSWALPHRVGTMSIRRVKPTRSRITPQQLSAIRERIGLAMDIPV
jgi:mRNA interferase MazF